MKCPVCGGNLTSITDSRSEYDGACVKRRRECKNCKSRFSTIETVLKGSIKKSKEGSIPKILLE